MGRLARVVATDIPHHLTQSGNGRRFVLDCDTIQGTRYRKSSRVKEREIAELIEAEHRELKCGIKDTPLTLKSMEEERKAVRLQIPTMGATAPPPITATMTLRQAGMIWLETKVWRRRKPKTIECSLCHLQARRAPSAENPDAICH
jgi:hypothetical protein